MLSPIIKFWNWVSMAGIWAAPTERQKKSHILLNRAWLIIFGIQILCLFSHMANGLTRSAQLTAVYLVGLAIVHVFAQKGKINLSKITAIVVINYNTIVMAVFLGPQTHIINFLLLTALMPLYLFETHQRQLIAIGIAVSMVPYAIYYCLLPHISHIGLPIAEQDEMFKATAWVMVLCMGALLWLMYNKNVNYEKEVQETEELLRGQKKLYESILEQIPVSIATFDKDLKYTFLNSSSVADPEMRKWMIGKTNLDYFKKRNLDVSVAHERDRMVLEALEKGAKVETEETFIDRHGKPYNSIKGSCPVYDEDTKELLCVIGYSMDVSGIKQAEKKAKDYAIELERRNADLQHFVNATSHDLKTPLRSIASYLQLLERKNADKLDADSKSLIAYVVTSVKHLNTLISDIYNYSVADRKDKPAEITDLNKVLDTVLKNSAEIVNEKRAVVQFTPMPQLLLAPSHIGQVFTNLIGNALKYNNSEQPEITIEYFPTATEYVFTVTDNGIGVPVEYSKKIFEIFRRLHAADAYEGTGVGLAICKKIVENYGGRIWVESQPKGGSAFYFSLAKNVVNVHNPMMRILPEYNQLGITG